MAAQQTHKMHFWLNLLAQKSQLHRQLGHIQNQINQIQVIMNLQIKHSALNFVCLSQLHGQLNYLTLTLDALESRIQAILDNRFNFTSYCQI